jgi:hypothetical protein
MPEINVVGVQQAITKIVSPGYHPNRIYCWAGDLDLYEMIDLPAHASDRVIVEGLLIQLRRDFGSQVQVKKISSTRWEVDCSECKEEEP